MICYAVQVNAFINGYPKSWTIDCGGSDNVALSIARLYRRSGSEWEGRK